RMAGVNAGLAKLGHALLARVAQERGLVKALADRRRGPGDMREVRKPDLSGQHRRLASVQAIQLLAGADPIRGGATGHVTVGLDPGGRALEAVVLALVGLGEAGRHPRALQPE